MYRIIAYITAITITAGEVCFDAALTTSRKGKRPVHTTHPYNAIFWIFTLCKIIVPFKTTALNMLSKVGRCHLIAAVNALLPNLQIAVHKI